MHKIGHIVAKAAIVCCAGVLAGCGSSANSLTTGSAETTGEVPGAVSNDHPLARPISVAWTSARAQRCGFHFDPAKLRASYLAYEGKQSAPDQLQKAEKSYDSTVSTIKTRISADPDYCSDRKSTEIKAELQRHLAGDFTPKLPQPKKVETCGFFGCAAPKSDEPFDAKKMYEDIERREGKRG